MSDRRIWDALWGHGGRQTDERLRDEVEEEEASFRCKRILRYMNEQGLHPERISVIEVGSGSGIYSAILAKRHATVTALDQSEVALQRVRERAKAVGVHIDEVNGDAVTTAKERSGQFDMAMSFGTVEHFRPPLRYEMCQAHWELVRVGGVVIISVPNVLFLPHEILKRLLILRGKWFLGYEGSFTPWELQRVGRRLGLVHMDMHGTNLTADVVKYWNIIRGTRLWARLFPWWRPAPGGRGGSSGPLDLDPPGRFTALANRYLGHDITLLGVKGG